MEYQALSVSNTFASIASFTLVPAETGYALTSIS